MIYRYIYVYMNIYLCLYLYIYGIWCNLSKPLCNWLFWKRRVGTSQIYMSFVCSAALGLWSHPGICWMGPILVHIESCWFRYLPLFCPRTYWLNLCLWSDDVLSSFNNVALIVELDLCCPFVTGPFDKNTLSPLPCFVALGSMVLVCARAFYL